MFIYCRVRVGVRVGVGVEVGVEVGVGVGLGVGGITFSGSKLSFRSIDTVFIHSTLELKQPFFRPQKKSLSRSLADGGTVRTLKTER